MKVLTSFLRKFYFFLFIYGFLSSAQEDKKPDTLLKLLKTSLHDTSRFNIFLELGQYFQMSNPDTALYFYSQAQKIAKKIAGFDGEIRKGQSLHQKGWVYYLKSEYGIAINYFDSSMKIVEKYIFNHDKNIKNKAIKLKVLNLGNFGLVHYSQGNYSKALDYYSRALSLNEEINDKIILSANLVNIGLVYNAQGDYSKALDYYLRASKLHEELNLKSNEAMNLMNIGNVYYAQGDLSKALDYYFKSLKLNEELGDKLNQSRNIGNIGNIYSDQADYTKALNYYLRALNIKEEIGDKSGQAINLGNIAFVYYAQGNFSESLNYLFRALKITEEIGDKSGYAINLVNIGNVFSDIGDFSNAMEYYFRALKISEEIGDKRSQAGNLVYIGHAYLKQKKYKQAEQYLKRSEVINRELGTINFLKDACSGLFELYELNGRYKDALYYFKEFIKARDSLMSEENRKASIVKEMQYNYEKEQALKEAEHQKQLAVEKEAKEKQIVITWSVVAGLVLVVLFSGFVVNRLNVTRKQKNIIEKQKQIVEEQKQIVEEQKKIVEQKNKDILDSINYARRIQNAILPSMSVWKQHLPDSFVLYLPKDVIAGDFYWMEVLDNYIYIAAADCTGHGVPGAMVSVVCANALTKSVLEEKLAETGQILNRTRELVIEKLTSEDNIRDGMDICLIRINKEKNQIQYSGANRPLYVIKDGNLEEYKPDKQPIGRYEESKLFSKQDINLTSGTALYLTTDGYADQFGGDKGKKIGTKVLKELLKENSRIVNSEEMREHLLNYLQQWKGNEEQLDDVTVVGLRV
jgi:tetratricopeptide (TPR) repeat protein